MVEENGAGRAGGAAPPGRSLRILLVLRAINMDRITEGLLRCTLEGGHTIHVALEQSKDRGGRVEGEESLFDGLQDEYGEQFSFDALPPRAEPWLHTATKLRCAIDLLRYYEPEFEDAEVLRMRAYDRAPWYARLLATLRVLKLAPARRMIDRFWRAVERRMPVSEQSLEMIRRFEPDIVVVSPLVEVGSAQGDHLRAANALGIPTGLVVASWDNLTTKGIIRDAPDLTIVWNEDQVREGVELHDLPAESMVVTGAHSHDHWFAWEPATSSEEFSAKVELAADRSFLLYVCSSGFIAGGGEVAFVREWAQRLASSGQPELEQLGVLVRPHPQNFGSWKEADVEQPGRLVVWPRGGVAPTDLQAKKDYFDSLYHAKAVVGINTTALVDSAIVRRPVFTMVQDRFRTTQTGTLHFSYLSRDGEGGLLNVAQSWDEHFDQLGAALRSADGHREQIDGFLRSFVRPHGLERPAAPLALDAIARTALVEKEPIAPRGPMRWVVGASASALGRMHLARERVQKRVQRWHRQRRRRRARLERAEQSGRKVVKGGKPAKGAKPAKPAKPGKPGKPAKAAKPAKPDGAAKPDKTARAAEKAARAAEKAGTR